jgi:hypothetical protein
MRSGTKKKRANRLRVSITFGGGEPRIFDRILTAEAGDVRAAIAPAVQAFNSELTRQLEAKRREARKPLDDTRDSDRAA